MSVGDCDLFWLGVGECDLFLAGCGWMWVSAWFITAHYEYNTHHCLEHSHDYWLRMIIGL